MKAYPFQVGDKVVLTGPGGTAMATVPKLAERRVYCVEKVEMSPGNALFGPCLRLHLCGVRLHRRRQQRLDGYANLPAEAFRLIGSQTREAA